MQAAGDLGGEFGLGHRRADGLEVAPVGGPGEGDDLRAGIVDVVFLGDLEPGLGQQVGEGVADHGAAAMADMHRAGGIGGDILDVDLDAGAGGGVAVGFPGRQDDGQQGAERCRMQAEVDEAGSGGLGGGDFGRGVQVLDQGGGDLGRRLAGGLGRDHGGVGRHVAMGGVRVGVTSTRAAISGGRSGTIWQRREDGFAQAGVKVGLVHGPVLARNGGLGRW